MATNINSLQNEIIKTIYKNTRDKKTQWIILESQKLLNECVQQKLNIKYFLCTQTWYDKHKQMVKIYHANIIVVNKIIIDKLSFTQSPQDFLIIIQYEINGFEVAKNGCYFILDNIQDPGNLGTIIRNAVAFDFKHLFISSTGVHPLNEKVVRSSMSAVMKIKINFYANLNDLINQLTELKLNVYATVLDDQAQNLNTIKSAQACAVILGNEGNGLVDLASSVSKLYIPIHDIESLNVASASSILMYSFDQLKEKCKK